MRHKPGRLGRLCLSIVCSVLSPARSAQVERDSFNLFVRAAVIYRFIRRYDVKSVVSKYHFDEDSTDHIMFSST